MQSGQIRSSHGYLEGAPRDQGLRCRDDGALAFPHRDLGAAPQQEAKVRTGEYPAPGAGLSLVDMKPGDAAPYPGAELSGWASQRQELAERNVG